MQVSRLSGLVITGILACTIGNAQIQISPTQNPQITQTGPQRPQSPGQQRAGSIAQSPQRPGAAQMLLGTLSGYVFWDASAIQYNVNSPCQGFSVTVSEGTVPNGQPTFEQFTALGTYNNVFTSKGNVGNYAVCGYSLDHLPIRTDLQLVIHPSSSNFKTAVVPVVPPTANWRTPIQIPGDNCPHILLSPLSVTDLGRGWVSCGDGVYNVNFLLQPPQSLSGLTSAVSTTQSKTQTPLPAPTGGLKSPGPIGTQQILLSPAAQTGMLSQGAVQNPGVINPSAGHDTSSLNPQPLPPRTASSSISTGNAARKTIPIKSIKLSLPRQSRKINNPKAEVLNTQMIAVLQNQTRAAEAEIAAMKLSLRPVALQVGPSQTMAANSANPVGTGVTATAATVVQTGSPQPMPSKYATLPGPLHNLVATCTYYPAMRVLTVSGGQSSAVFTQDPKYNFYTISGCSFGDPGPNAKAYIYSQGTFHEDLRIEQWSDNWLKLSIDPSLTGVDDQSNVTLVIQREDGKQTSKSGFRFFAARETILVPQIPQKYFSLNRFRPDSSVTNSWSSTYTSGSSAAVVPNLPGLSAEVHWDLTTDSHGGILGGSDIYDFGQLHSSFALDSASMEWSDVSCTDPSYNQFTTSSNSWSVDWYQSSGVQVSWQGQACEPTPGSCGGGGFPVKPDCFLSAPQSNYGVNVWVTGPRGLDPWTGKAKL